MLEPLQVVINAECGTIRPVGRSAALTLKVIYNNTIFALMETQSHPDRSIELPRDAYYQLIHTLRRNLPPPVTDTPKDLAHRNNAAIAQAAGLLPATAAEAHLAGQFVAANAQAMECLRLARDPVMPLPLVLQCSAQSASMMRQSQSALRMLLALQAARQKLEANAPALERAAWTEHCAAGLMAHALAGAPHAAVDLPPPPPSPAPAPEPPPEPAPDPAAEAEAYATTYPRRAALIRQLGRLPDNPSFGAPEEYLVRALVAGRTPALLALDAAGRAGAGP
jgi:hypothetical protein